MVIYRFLHYYFCMDYLDFGFIRCACCSPDLHVADCKYNTQKIYEAAVEAKKNGAAIIVFPELSITGYTCGDLFFQTALQKSAEDSLAWLVEKTKEDFDGNNLKKRILERPFSKKRCTCEASFVNL